MRVADADCDSVFQLNLVAAHVAAHGHENLKLEAAFGWRKHHLALT